MFKRPEIKIFCINFSISPSDITNISEFDERKYFITVIDLGRVCFVTYLLDPENEKVGRIYHNYYDKSGKEDYMEIIKHQLFGLDLGQEILNG